MTKTKLIKSFTVIFVLGIIIIAVLFSTYYPDYFAEALIVTTILGWIFFMYLMTFIQWKSDMAELVELMNGHNLAVIDKISKIRPYKKPFFNKKKSQSMRRSTNTNNQ